MVHNTTLLLNVARNLQYRTIVPMLGESVTIRDRAAIVTETTALVARFSDECSYAGPEQKWLDGQIAKYGILDLHFNAQPTMLDGDAERGVPLLRELGFIDNKARRFIEEMGGDDLGCLQELRDSIAKSKTHLLLFLKSSSPNVSEMSIADRMARIRDPSLITFPITFSVVDACVSNSSYVWMKKHFYL